MPDTLAARTEAGSAVAPSVLRLPVAPEHCTVLGYRVKEGDLLWSALFLKHAWLDDGLPCFHYLHVPWEHPDDLKRCGGVLDIDDCPYYRVRSRYEPDHRYRFTIDGRARVRKVQSVAFERQGDAWWIVLGLDP